MSVDTTSSIGGFTVNSDGTRVYDPNKPRVVNTELGKDEFLKVLVAQMSNQDPMEPTTDTQFIAQMAQFSSLEQMQNMNEATQSQRAYSMLGKDITSSTVVDNDGNAHTLDVYGNVTGVQKVNGIEYLRVYDYELEMEFFVSPSAVSSTNTSVTTQDQLLSIYQLLAKISGQLGVESEE